MKKYLKSLIGFPVGNLMLALSYVLIYVVDGEATYITEIAKLSEFKYMLGQFIFSGMIYTIVLLTISFITEIFGNNEKATAKNLGKFIVLLGVMFAVCKTISLIINRRGSLKGYSGTVFYTISIVVMVAVSIGYAIYREVQNKKINNALKKRQNNN